MKNSSRITEVLCSNLALSAQTQGTDSCQLPEGSQMPYSLDPFWEFKALATLLSSLA